MGDLPPARAGSARAGSDRAVRLNGQWRQSRHQWR
jgi:hypothetical protein